MLFPCLQDKAVRLTSNPTDKRIASKAARMATSTVPKTCKVVTAETISKGLLADVKQDLVKLQETRSEPPTLVAFLANDDPAARTYAEYSKKTCEDK